MPPIKFIHLLHPPSVNSWQTTVTRSLTRGYSPQTRGERALVIFRPQLRSPAARLRAPFPSRFLAYLQI